MKRFEKLFKNVSIRIIPLFILTLLLLVAIRTYTVKIDVDNLNEIGTSIEKNIKDDKKVFVKNALLTGYQICQQSSDLSAKRLETELYKNYDLDKLESSFSKGLLPNDFYKFIKDTLDTMNDDNILFEKDKTTMVGNIDGVMAIFNSGDDTQKIKYDKDVMPWKEYLDTFHNKKLASHAFDRILNNKKGIAYWQKTPDKTTVSESDIDHLVDLYLEGGVDALEPYYFINSSFITEDGDIFGTLDNNYLSSIDNYKMVVINSVNVKEVIEKFEADMLNMEYSNYKTLALVENYSNTLHIKAIFYNFLIITVAVSTAILYNRALQTNRKQ